MADEVADGWITLMTHCFDLPNVTAASLERATPPISVNDSNVIRPHPWERYILTIRLTALRHTTCFRAPSSTKQASLKSQHTQHSLLAHIHAHSTSNKTKRTWCKSQTLFILPESLKLISTQASGSKCKAMLTIHIARRCGCGSIRNLTWESCRTGWNQQFILPWLRRREFSQHYTLDRWSAACSRRLLVTRIFNVWINPRLSPCRLIIGRLRCWIVTTSFLRRSDHFGCPILSSIVMPS